MATDAQTAERRMSMTDREAIDKAQNELDTSSYLAELGLNIGLRTIHRRRIAWLARVLRLARKGLYIEENQKQPKTNGDRIRSMSDDALCERLYHIWRSEADRGNDIAMNWCHPECCMSEECDPDKHKACILRWLQQPAEVE